MIVVAERLQLLDGTGVIVAVVDRRIGCAVTLGKCGVIVLDCLLGFFFVLCVVRPAGEALVSGAGGIAEGGGSPPPPATASSGGESRNDRGRRNQRRQKHGQCHKPDYRVDHARLLLMQVGDPSSRRS